MSDDEIWNLFWKLVSYAATAFGTVAFATWWLKSQLVGGEIAGLKAENKSLRAEVGNVTASREVLDQRRLLAEEQRKKTEDELLKVRVQLETAMAQIDQHASAQALSAIIEVARISTSSAISANNATGTFLKPHSEVKLFVEPGGLDKLKSGDYDPTRGPSKRGNLGLAPGSGDMDWPGRDNKRGQPK